MPGEPPPKKKNLNPVEIPDSMLEMFVCFRQRKCETRLCVNGKFK